MELETMAESVRSSRSNGTPSRHEKSLGLLTIKFVTLLQEAKDGVLDLKLAADSLAVRQKRRIYDITNVLEGVGLIEKKTKNIIQWRGENMGSQSEEVLEQVEILKAEISELEAQERQLDERKAWLEQSIKHLCHDPITCSHKYVTHDDICNAFHGDTLLAVVAPSGTQLEVPLPELGPSGQKRYQVTLRSQTAPIQVLLINRETPSSQPVVFSVPPGDDASTLPTPPNTPATLQRFPLNSSSSCSSYVSSHYSSGCSPDSLFAGQPHHHHQMAPQGYSLSPSSTPPDVQMECHGQPVTLLMQQMVSGQPLSSLVVHDFHSMLDVSCLLRHSGTGEPQKEEEREGVADLIDELMSTDGVDYNFNLDDNEGVCDLFDVQILNY
ncbi:transcription factor E2F5 isoform X1 [Gadus morhua]|uniref:E2F transcription factor 5 n=1 Tax=Gadus morhua TaxID=8049 RepID=A0A8C4ZF93_GADMO|nr:transcription factor E2F5-like isoform X1 [Gadus morhua]